MLVGSFLQMDMSVARHSLQLICTSFDDAEELLEKYPESRGILQQLARFPNVQVGCRACPSAAELEDKRNSRETKRRVETENTAELNDVCVAETLQRYRQKRKVGNKI